MTAATSARPYRGTVDPSSRRDRAVDTLIAAAFVAVSVLLSIGLTEGPERRAVAVALGAVHAGSLAFRRRWPVGVVVVMAATALLSLPAGVPAVVLGPAVLVAVYTVGARCDLLRSRQVLGGVLVVTAGVVVGNGADAGTVTSNSVALAVAWWLGDRSRRAAAAAEADRLAAAEHARRAVVDERLRIARELHDVVAHAMSVIAVQAGTGRFVLERSPDVAADALATIERTSRAALQELRRLLTVLREEDVEDTELAPAPGVADLGRLVELTATAGVAVEIDVRGERRALPAGVELCVYRVVQEALTNVQKHARARRAVVTIEYAPTDVGVEVCDDGIGTSAPSTRGHGLVGMRERVALYGGSLETGPNGVGFRVAARIPIEGGA